MPFHLQSHIRAFFSPLFRAIGMSSAPSSAYFEFRSGSNSDVNTYSELLALNYGQEGAARMNAMRITELRLVKQMDKISRHEYVVACVTTPHGTTQYLSLERLRGDTVTRASQSDSMLTRTSSKQRSFPSRSPSTSSSSESSMDYLSKRSDALDAVRTLDKPLHAPGDCVLGSLRFAGTRPFYLYELVVLAVTMHESQACYRLFSTNCYWFAGLLMNILEKDYGLKLAVEKRRGVKPGTWIAIPVYEQAPDKDLLAVIGDFQEHVGSF
jgi:hypothetical protein